MPEGWWHAVANLAPAQGADLVDGAEPSCDGEEGSANSPAVAVGAQVAAPLEGGRLAVAQAVVPLMESGQTDAARWSRASIKTSDTMVGASTHPYPPT